MRFRSFDFQNLLLPLDYNRFIEKLVIGWISIDEQLAQPQQVLPASELWTMFPQSMWKVILLIYMKIFWRIL